MDTYQFAEKLYKDLNSRYTYENLIKVFETHPDEMIKFMKEIYEKYDPVKQTKVERITDEILSAIEYSVINMGHVNHEDVVYFLYYDAAEDLPKELKELTALEIKQVIDAVSENSDSDEWHFYWFEMVLKDLKNKYLYPQYNELIDLIKNNNNPYISDRNISIMIG